MIDPETKKIALSHIENATELLGGTLQESSWCDSNGNSAQKITITYDKNNKNQTPN